MASFRRSPSRRRDAGCDAVILVFDRESELLAIELFADGAAVAAPPRFREKHFSVDGGRFGLWSMDPGVTALSEEELVTRIHQSANLSCEHGLNRQFRGRRSGTAAFYMKFPIQ